MTSLHHLAIGALAASALPSDADQESLHALDLGPQHPSRTGLLLLDVHAENGCITDVRIQPGYNHRSAEKLFEVRDYRQILMLADRHDWHSPFTGELGIALVCEHLMGLVPPERATWLRTLLAEQARIQSHLAHLGFIAHHTEDDALGQRIRAARNGGRELLLAISGNRVHPMMNRLGGLAFDVEPGWIGRIGLWAAECADLSKDIATVIKSMGIGAGLGTIDPAQVDQFSLSGPVAAASGVLRRTRTSNPHLGYAELAQEFGKPTHTEGDAASRFLTLCDEVDESARLIARCREILTGIEGPVDTKLSKIVKLPDSEAYLALDAPWGMAGFQLVSRAERTPWRLKLRTPSLANVQVMEQALVGCSLQDASVTIASLGWTAGDLDK